MSTTRCLYPDNPNRKTGNLPPLYSVYHGGENLNLNMSCLYIYKITVSIKLFINVIIPKGNFIIGSNISIKYLSVLITCSLSYLFNNSIILIMYYFEYLIEISSFSIAACLRVSLLFVLYVYPLQYERNS